MKKGISLVSLVITIIIMVILASVIIISGSNSIEDVTINTFAIEILNIQNAVDTYYLKYGKYPALEDYTLDTTYIQGTYLLQFDSETIADNQIALKTVDLSLIGINKTEFGNNDSSKDIYVLSEVTGRVYYLSGVEYKGITYYTLMNELFDITGIQNTTKVSVSDIKKYDVLFTPSETKPTNKPVSVNIRLPKDATINNIAVTGSKSISEETLVGMYKQYQINIESEDKTGNYTITVNYTYEDSTKSAEYVVTNFDNTNPVINTETIVENDYKTITVNATDSGSGIKTVKYEEKEIQDISYFKDYGKQLNGNKIRLQKDNAYTIYVEDEAGNYATIVVVGQSAVPVAWRNNVKYMYNLVPIPKGFVASQATGENTVDGGLVIYEGTDPVTDDNVETAKRTRNQYVWVPVDDFTNQFVRKDFLGDRILSNELGTDYWEVVLDTATNMPLSTQDTTYMTSTTLAEVQAMYASVKEYKGFYIARYEAGIDTQRTEKGNAADLPGIQEGTKVYSVMGKIPYTYIPWTWNNSMSEDTNGAVEVARGLHPKDNTNTTGVISTLTYGVQWDATLQWWLDTGAVTSVTDSIDYGNYCDHIINSADGLNEGALVWDYSASSTGLYVEKGSDTLVYPKANGEQWVLSTGALKNAKVNNICDMAGNVAEWTMAGRVSDNHLVSGGYFAEGGSEYEYGYPVYHSFSYEPYMANLDIGFRVSLYIKK